MKLLVITMTLLIASFAVADWTENFDSYAAGSGLSGQGGWFPWGDTPAGEAYVTTDMARSAPNSLDAIPTADMVHEFNVMSGTPEISAWNYIPTGSTGDQFFILLSVYMGNDSEWTLQLKFACDDSQLIVTEGTAIVPIVYDQWVEVKVEIDLAANMQKIYYNGVLIDTIAWSPTSIYQFGALDLFSDGGSSIYWDDIVVIGEVQQDLAPTTWAAIKASIK